MLALFALTCMLQAGPQGPFAIQVVDAKTGRGAPLIELTTVNKLRYVTDSNGLVAFDEPGLMGHKVFFHVSGHGYECPKDGFGYRGKAIDVVPGGSARVEVQRTNIAERLYRVTGAGIYADTLRLGRTAPIEAPGLNALVLGSDSVVNHLYRGKLLWFWGDTNRPSYPLGNFHVPGATSVDPTRGGFDAEKGINLTYFVGDQGFAKETCRMPGQGPTWIGGLALVREESGAERLFAGYVKVRNFLDVYEHGLVEWDDEEAVWKKVVTFPEGLPNYPSGHPLYHEPGYVHFANPYPWARVRRTADDLAHPERYEAWTCLKPGSTVAQAEIERGTDGRPLYAWKPNTPPISFEDQEKLEKAGVLKPGEGPHVLRDVETGKVVRAHGGSVEWNPYRKRFVMIAVEMFGTSVLGEVWYSEADRPEGPWEHARKIVSHDRYSFYNPKQHPYFSKDNGRTIFFEGTYTITFSGNPCPPTPRYDYNQIMYKLDLSDPRLALTPSSPR